MTAAHICPRHRPCALCDPAIALAIEFESRANGVFWGCSKICGPLRVIGCKRYAPRTASLSAERNRPGAGLVIEIVPDAGRWLSSGPGRAVSLTLPQRWLLGDGSRALRALADAGLTLAADPRADALVIRYLRLAAAELRKGQRDGH